MKSKRFACFPGGWFLPAFFAFAPFVWIGLLVFSWLDKQLSPFIVLGCSGFVVLSVYCFRITLRGAGSWVEFCDTHLVCKAPFHRDIVIEYDRCFIGMDYHVQNGGRIWWIYFCYGKMPPYKNPKSGNRINSVQCQPGFVRILFREEVYDHLLSILPKHPKSALESARRVAGFDRQGHIV